MTICYPFDVDYWLQSFCQYFKQSLQKKSFTWITSTLYLFSYGWLSSYNWCWVWHTNNWSERAEGEASDLGHGRAGEIPCCHTQLLQRSRRGPHGVWHHQVDQYSALITLRLHVQCYFLKKCTCYYISHKEHMWFLLFFCRRSTYNHLSSWLTDARNLTNPNTVSSFSFNSKLSTHDTFKFLLK